MPADTYWKIERPQDAFGAHAGTPMCTAAATAVDYSTYVVGGFPLRVVKKLGSKLAGPVGNDGGR